MSSRPQTGETLIQVLHRLQKIELQLASIRRRREQRARRLDVQKRKIAQVNGRLEEHNRTVRARQVRLDALALEISARESAAQKHREALNKAKTNKEYAGILAAMNTEKADAARIESGVLQLIDEVQALKDEAVTIETEKLALVDELNLGQQKLEDFEIEHHDNQARLEAERDAAAQAVPPTTLSSFLRIAARHDGEAMAEVTRLHPKREEYGCSGCNLTLSLEVVNALQSRDEVNYCGSCGRILYLASGAAEE